MYVEIIIRDVEILITTVHSIRGAGIFKICIYFKIFFHISIGIFKILKILLNKYY